MTRIGLQDRAAGLVQTQQFIGELKGALDQQSLGGKVITGAEAQQLIDLAEPLPPGYLSDLKEAVQHSLTAEDHWQCDAGARQLFADFVGLPADKLPPAVQPPAEQLAAQRATQAAEIAATLDNIQALAPEISPESNRLLASRGRAVPATQYDGSQGGLLNLLSQAPAVPAQQAAPAPMAASAPTAYSQETQQLLNQLYGAGAAQQMSDLEVLTVQIEIALLAALQGADGAQILAILGDDSPAARALAGDILNMAQLLNASPINMGAVEQALYGGRDNFINYAASRPGADPAQIRQLAQGELGVTQQPRPPVSTYAPSEVPKAGRYEPFSGEARALFREAAKRAGVPEAWADSPGLHNILKRESNGVVGIPNYTYGGRKKNPAQWGQIHAELKSGKISAKSSATGLGQLLLRNVDRYYPSGRAGIGDPVEEAAGMLAYIKDRYGSPERAWALYGKLHEGY